MYSCTISHYLWDLGHLQKHLCLFHLWNGVNCICLIRWCVRIEDWPKKSVSGQLMEFFTISVDHSNSASKDWEVFVISISGPQCCSSTHLCQNSVTMCSSCHHRCLAGELLLKKSTKVGKCQISWISWICGAFFKIFGAPNKPVIRKKIEAKYELGGGDELT